MKIKFVNGVAGARFVYYADEVHDLPELQARQFVEAKQAVFVTEDEHAVTGAPENAAKRTGRGRRSLRNLGGLIQG